MSWFQTFIEQSKLSWATLGGMPKVAKLAEDIMSTTDVGKVGEEFVKQILDKQFKYTGITPGSRTPADVWGFRTFGDFIHLTLIQSKTTRGENPAKLTDTEEKEIVNFCSFVIKEFQSSNIVPEEYKTKKLIVSCGYAGILMDDEENCNVHSRYYIGMRLSSNIENALVDKEFRQDIQNSHLLKY